MVTNLCLCQGYQALAQRPPTGGAAPVEDNGVSPAVFIVGGVVIGAASYFYIKSRSPKIPVASHLPDYLRSHQIMPNPDALELMYALNPSLNNIEVIRSSKKLNLPSFPSLDHDAAKDLATEGGSSIADELQLQMDQFERSKGGFEQMISQNPNLAAEANSAEIRALISKVETELNSIEGQGETTSTITKLLTKDLVAAFDQTLQEITVAKRIEPTQLALLEGIATNLSELLSETGILTFRMEKDRLLALAAPDLEEPYPTYLSTRLNETNLPSFQFTLLRFETTAPNNTMDFAFAVYMYSENGELITEGPKVEGKFTVRYVLPALKDFENAYHTIRTPATYAVAAFPPAKMFFVVEDLNGNRMNVQYPTIDFREEFAKPQLYNEDQVIVVPLRISP
jgi:hypothetical protein